MDSISITRREVILASSQVVITSLFSSAAFASTEDPRQRGWRFCTACYSMFFGPEQAGVFLPAPRISRQDIDSLFTKDSQNSRNRSRRPHKISGVSVESATHSSTTVSSKRELAPQEAFTRWILQSSSSSHTTASLIGMNKPSGVSARTAMGFSSTVIQRKDYAQEAASTTKPDTSL